MATVPVDRERFLGSQWSAARGHRVFCPLRLLHVFSSPFILYLFLYFFNSELRSSVETFTVIKVHSNKTFHHCSELISLSHTYTHTHSPINKVLSNLLSLLLTHKHTHTLF